MTGASAKECKRVAAKRPKQVITFDCYGTLLNFDIDGTTRQLIGDVAERGGVEWETLRRDFATMRWQAIMLPILPYKTLLKRCLEHAMSLHRLEYREKYGDALVEAVKTYEPHPDVVPALELLQPHYQLAIISNSDDDLIRENAKHIGVPFDYLITAEAARCYKPNEPTFRYAFEQIGLPPEAITHVAQGYEYDIMPMAKLGIRRIWVNRAGRKVGRPKEMPYDELPDFTGLPGLLGVATEAVAR
jgi:2-haloacid dehalogenase